MSEEIKPIALVDIELHLSDGISQSVQKIKETFKISNLMQRFRVI